MPSYEKNSKTSKHGFFYFLDCQSGEGLVNPLLKELKRNSSPDEFNYYLNFFLKKCININRSFSDAVEFLSIWLDNSPDSLLEKLRDGKLTQYFNRTEYGHDGNQWILPRLLRIFLVLIEKKSVTANEILDYLFQTFYFFNDPEDFVIEIIGYDRLEECIKESPAIFKEALLLKISEFVEKNGEIDIGLCSRIYLNNEIPIIDHIKRAKKQSDKQTDREELISYMLDEGGFFNYSSVKNFNSSEASIVGSNYFRGWRY